jgi:murein DD-endopeptidase MepM/ murein hydrolase activator NlpD
VKKRTAWKIIKYYVVGYFLLIAFLFIVAIFPQRDEVEIALVIDVPYEIVKEIESAFGSTYPYYMAIAAIDLACDWESYKEENYIQTLKTYNQRMLNDLYSYDDSFKAYVDIYQQAYGDIKNFVVPTITYWHPVMVMNEDGSKSTIWIPTLVMPSYQVYDDFGAERNYKELTRHKGNDTIADVMTPLVSMTDGVLERVGWNEHGGWRIGVRAPSGAYFYYAHMEKYGPDIKDGFLKQGDRISAGQLLGYVGDTGYGPVGTQGKFVNHLHLQIGVKLEDYDGDFWVNPYNPMMLREDVKSNIDIYFGQM